MQGEACPYSHANIAEPCKQLVLDGICQAGPSCPSSHASLPEYAVQPLQEWFREQDQLQLARTASCVQDPSPLKQDGTAYPAAQQRVQGSAAQQAGLVLSVGNMHATASALPLSGDAAARADASCPELQLQQGVSPTAPVSRRAVKRYSSWTDGWCRLYAKKLHGLATPEPVQLEGSDEAALHPLQGPYTSWHDGWNRLFASQENSRSGPCAL